MGNSSLIKIKTIFSHQSLFIIIRHNINVVVPDDDKICLLNMSETKDAWDLPNLAQSLQFNRYGIGSDIGKTINLCALD